MGEDFYIDIFMGQALDLIKERDTSGELESLIRLGVPLQGRLIYKNCMYRLEINTVDENREVPLKYIIWSKKCIANTVMHECNMFSYLFPIEFGG